MRRHLQRAQTVHMVPPDRNYRPGVEHRVLRRHNPVSRVLVRLDKPFVPSVTRLL